MLRLLIIVCLVLFQPNAKASQNISCDQKTTPIDCNQEAGCYWSTGGVGYCNSCDRNHYCPSENTDTKSPTECRTLGGNFNFTDGKGYGAASDCYKDIGCYIYDMDKDCIQYYGTNEINCDDVIYLFAYNADPNQDYVHLEKMSGSYNTPTKCFTNVISCNKVQTTTTTNCTKDGSKEAKYYYKSANSADQYWDISACRCTQQNSSVSGANCKARVTRKPKNDTVSYMTTASPVWEIDSYYCTGCNQGYWANGTQSNDTPLCKYTENETHAILCQCFPAQKGYYATGCNLNYPLESSYVIANACPRTPCPAGKTTISQVATSANDCAYSPHTKFCDSKGCFSLSDIQDWIEVQ